MYTYRYLTDRYLYI